jgi:Domain of unknown function (DUF4352)
MSEIQTPSVPTPKKWYQKKLIIIPLGLILLFAIIGSMGGSKTDKKIGEVATAGTSMPATVNNATSQTPAAPALKASYKVGDIIEVNKFVIKVNSVNQNADSGNPYTKPKDGNKFVTVDITLENKGETKETVSSFINFYIKNAEGEKGTSQFLSSLKPVDGELLAGDKIKGELAYEIAANSKGLKLYYNPTFLFGKSIVVEL